MPVILEVKDLTKYFGGIKAVNALDFTVKSGEIKGIIGPNGAGKTTVFNLITGVYPVTRGSILLENKALNGRKPHEIVKLGVARTFQNIRLFRNLTAKENIITALDCNNSKYSLPSALLRLPNMRKSNKFVEEKSMELLQAVDLEEYAEVKADSLPYGLQRKLEIARALALDPKILLLDEPAAGMNPEETNELARLIRKLKKQYNLSIILIEHHMDMVMSLCDSITVINFGELLFEGTPAEVQQNPQVIKAYLGGE